MDAHTGLSEFEKTAKYGGQRAFPRWHEAKLLLVASTGFFIDAYDLFVINLIVPILNILLYGTRSGTVKQIALEGGVLKAAANLGCIVGQIGFGLLGDMYGRRRVWPAGLVVTIIGTVLMVAGPLSLGAAGLFTWITIWRVLMGIGIGGDYPMSSAAISDRSSTNRRGMLLAFTFSMQGWGNIAGGRAYLEICGALFGCLTLSIWPWFPAVVTLVTLYAYQTQLRAGESSKLNGAWRIIAGVIIVPCLGTLYQRLVLPESEKFKKARAIQDNPDLLKKGEAASDTIGSDGHRSDAETGKNSKMASVPISGQATATDTGLGLHGVTSQRKAAFREFIDYFTEWKHAKLLFGTASTWFLLDIAFYGINLNQSIVLGAVGFNSTATMWDYLHDNVVGNLIITACGYLPGYWLSIATIEYIGRKPIQLIGFFMNTVMFFIIGGLFDRLQHEKAAFIVCFSILQLFFNFGANTSTFIVPSEVFPTRVRGFAHGFSAACGKLGAVLASLVFSIANTHVGTAKVLYIFGGISAAGFVITYFCQIETKGLDPDVIDLQEQQEKAGFRGRIEP